MPLTRSSTKKQSRLTFTPIPSSSPAPATALDQTGHASFVQSELSPTPSKMARKPTSPATKLSSTTEKSPAKKVTLPTPAPSSQIEQNYDEDSSDSTQTESEIPVSSNTFGRYARRRSGGSNTLPLTPQSSKVPTANAMSSVLHPQDIGSPSQRASVEVDIDKTVNFSSPWKRRASPSTNLRSSGRLKIHSKPEANILNEISKSKTDERHPIVRKLRRRSSSSASTINSSANNDWVKSSSSRKNKAAIALTRTADSPTSEGSSEDVVVPRRRRRLVTQERAEPSEADLESSVSKKQVADELKEDLDDLRNSDICKHRTRGKTVNSERTHRQKKLEILKRRRDGGKAVELSSDSDTLAPSLARPLTDKQETHDHSSQNEVSDTEHDSAAEAIRKSLRADAEENDSCVDDDGFLGAHGLDDIPIELTRHSHKKPIEHFTDAVKWIVHNELNPAFPRNDMIYRIAFLKLDDEVKGYSISKFESAAWNRDFLQTLKTLPELAANAIRTLFDHKCDACNRSKHPAKHQLVFSGKPYDIDTLEDVEEDEGGDGDGDDLKKTSRIADTNQSRPFYLGSTCAANAETAHGLIHWKYHLKYYVCKYLTNWGHTTCHKIIERDSWSIKKRTKYANDVVDEMVKTGEMKILHKEFKENLAVARSLRPEGYHYGRR